MVFYSHKHVIVLAPQRQQVVDMEKAEFPSPTTVANFLLRSELAGVNGNVELTDGRVLDKSFREFLPGYAVTLNPAVE